MKALDLFCGGGGVAYGLLDLGFDVTGVDITDQPNYPGRFIKGDAITFPLDGFDFVWASPVCKGYTNAARAWGSSWSHKNPDELGAIIDRLTSWGGVWAVENVPGAPFRPGAVVLDGRMFGLRVIRRRVFQTSSLVLAPELPTIKRNGRRIPKNLRNDADDKGIITVWGKFGNRANANALDAMGLPPGSLTPAQTAQAIPPAYARFIASALLPALQNRRSA